MPKPLSRHLTIVLAALAAGMVSGSSVAANFTHGPYRITVAADAAETLPTPHYEITIADEERLLTRLLAPYTGTLSHSFVADLDSDGRFEIIVTYSHAGGMQTDMRVFSWRDGHRLEPVAVAPLDAAQHEGYRGGDEFALVDGQIVRIFQVYALENGAWQPTAAQRRLRYAFAQARWITAP